ncbi:MAG: ABC transporter substrate-binding protein [SAR324 cluster bacterium]|nr:ABC transporter substrate-binding protein [SAR324 cluster bacterium]
MTRLFSIFFAALLAQGLLLGVQPGQGAEKTPYVEPPSLAAQVKARTLPPVQSRLPREPSIAEIQKYGGTLGRYGGEWRMLVYRAKDVRMMLVYGYARLIAYDRYYNLGPDLLKKFEMREGRIFTLTLREGHRWSDGAPFTSENFRYYWEDVANNRALYPAGMPRILLVEGKPPEFEVLSKTKVRYSWHAPNPYFLHALARPLPLEIFLPSHYLKNFHARYTSKEDLERLTKQYRKPNWAALHHKIDDFRNPLLPTLQPWINRTPQPATRFLGVRNPYYHRVDSRGNQLPYIDRLIISVTDSRLIAAKSGAGETDLQARGLDFNDYTFLKMGEKRNKFQVRLWKEARGAHLALYPNLNVNDPQWRKLFRDVRFRRALSMAINRHEINQVLFYGLTLEGNNTVQPDSPLYEDRFRTNWTKFDLKHANRLLDELGLTERRRDGVRLLPDGRAMEIIVETAGERTLQTDVLELIGDSWLKAGIKIFVKPSQREVFRRRIFSGDTQMSIWYGLENGMATPESDPWELAPVAQITLQWPKWGRYYQTKGRTGQPPDMALARELLELYMAWQTATSSIQRTEIWKRMLEIHADQLFTLGLVSGMFQPVVVSDNMANVPETGVYNWDPGSFFGIYRPDTFWFKRLGKSNVDVKKER